MVITIALYDHICVLCGVCTCGDEGVSMASQWMSKSIFSRFSFQLYFLFIFVFV